MGLFSSIFGSGGSDKADKMRQNAIDAFNSIKTPELSALQVQLNDYVNAGKITPEQAEATLLGSNAFNAIQTDPSLAGAQKQALASLQNVGTSGGLTAIDKAQLQDITDQQNQEARGRNEAVLSRANERGMGGSDISTVNQLLNEQSAADRASRAGTDVAANAQVRALQAMQAAGTTAGQIRGQEYGEAAAKAESQNAVDKFNAQTSNQTNLFNTQTSNAAQAANLANAQAIANANTSTQNTGKEYNAQQNQVLYNDALQKAQGIAGTEQNWANSADKKAEDERNASAGLVQGGLQAGATAGMTAMAGPAAGVVTNAAMSPKKQDPNDPASFGFSKGGEVPMPECGYCSGGEAHMKHGGKVPGTAKVAGDSPKNDTVHAALSPGEVVVPRSAQSDDQEFEAFMNKFRPSKRPKPLDAHIPLAAHALANLHSRITNLERGQ
jgi:hypothetical protein